MHTEHSTAAAAPLASVAMITKPWARPPGFGSTLKLPDSAELRLTDLLVRIFSVCWWLSQDGQDSRTRPGEGAEDGRGEDGRVRGVAGVRRACHVGQRAARLQGRTRGARGAAPATVDKPPPAAAAARGSRTAPTAPAAVKRGTAPHAARRTGTLHATKMRKTSKQLETAERDQRAWRDLVSMSVHLVGWRLSMARSLCIRAVPGHGSVGGDRGGRQ